MMLMGITVFLMVFVPMGFQFLAALGGKAFLMAKLALLLASVNGLKRVDKKMTQNLFIDRLNLYLKFLF